MMVDPVIKNSAAVLRTKVDLLSWVGILPRSHIEVSKFQSNFYVELLTDKESTEEIISDATESVKSMNMTMDQGIRIIMRKITSPECVECGKCAHLNDVLQMLLDDEPIHEIQAKIEENLGDITTEGVGMPGHQRDRPGIRVVEIARGSGSMDDAMDVIKDIVRSGEHSADFAAIMTDGSDPRKGAIESLMNDEVKKGKGITNLINMIKDIVRSGEHSENFAAIMTDGSDPRKGAIESLMNKFFGRTPSKDKFH